MAKGRRLMHVFSLGMHKLVRRGEGRKKQACE